MWRRYFSSLLTPRSYNPDSQLGDGGFQRQVR